MIEYDEKSKEYIIKKALCSDRKHDSDFIEAFVEALESNGFSSFQVLIPLNSDSSEKCISVENYMKIGRIYASQIIVGENHNNGDSVKALLVDYESKCSFDDEDYTDGYGYPAVLVKSSNPVRAHYLVSQLQLFTEREGKRRFFSRRWLPLLLLTFLIYFIFRSIQSSTLSPFSLVQNKSMNFALNCILVGLCFVFMIALLVDSTKRLWIATKRKKSFKRWFIRFYRGEFNNYIVSRIANLVVGAIIGVIITRLLN